MCFHMHYSNLTSNRIAFFFFHVLIGKAGPPSFQGKMRFPALQGLFSFLRVALTKEINKPLTQKLTVRGAIQQD